MRDFENPINLENPPIKPFRPNDNRRDLAARKRLLKPLGFKSGVQRAFQIIKQFQLTPKGDTKNPAFKKNGEQTSAAMFSPFFNDLANLDF